ncbi:hypothetical protein [Pantoea piersonii]|uniref:hypothetical protein n=1 Tax=Pantoea piersonii TaxID=2364647 RepID=UPI0022F1C4EE|nr:hypothetical protein [Pantoea piersonii]WBV22589.1 hypothetical protein PG877_05375 [Pantoea piersonii]
METATVNWLDLISKLVVPILVSVVAASLAAKLAVNRFYKEKWWEKRLTSFTEVIELAYRINKTQDYFLEIEYSKKNLQSNDFDRHPPDIESQLISQYLTDKQEIERISQLSEFTLTMQASKIIATFLIKQNNIRKAYNENSITEMDASECNYEASKNLLESLVAEAKRELKVT